MAKRTSWLILNFLTLHPGSGSAEIIERLGLGRSAGMRQLQRLREGQHVVRDRLGRYFVVSEQERSASPDVNWVSAMLPPNMKLALSTKPVTDPELGEIFGGACPHCREPFIIRVAKA